MSYERLVGLNIGDERRYHSYRSAMKPILLQYGGRFRYDFRVSEVLASETTNPINRIFIISFPGKTEMEQFFTDPDYVIVKTRYFESSVESTTLISTYELS